jgi:hypothetical protein
MVEVMHAIVLHATKVGSWHIKVSIFLCHKGNLGGAPLSLVQYVLEYD